MDPAWFYSSLAQTSAAVVGLVGGFLVSKVIDHGAALRASRRDVLERIGEFRTTRAARRRRWREGESFLKQEMERIKVSNAYVAGHLWDFEGHQATSWRSINAKSLTAKLREQLVCVERALERYEEPLKGKVLEADLTGRAADLEATAEEALGLPGVEHMRSGFKAMQAEADGVRTTAGRLEALCAELLPVSMAVLGALLLCVGIFAILWPLSVLSALPGASKPAMLTALGAGLVGLPAYVAFEVVRLRGLGSIGWND